MTKKQDFTIPKIIVVNGVRMMVHDIDLDGSAGHYEARVEYRPIQKTALAQGSFTIRFDSNENFLSLLALANGHVEES